MTCHRCPPLRTPRGTRDDYDELLWRSREVATFVEQTIQWGDEEERFFWRSVLEGLLSGPHYADVAWSAWQPRWSRARDVESTEGVPA